jgi:hypothetical protein
MMRAMRIALLAALVAGCAPATYTYSFDMTDPGARNVQKPGQHDVLEDADVKSELLVDPTSFQAVMFKITNKTEGNIQINWGAISMLMPDRSQQPLQPDAGLGAVEPGATLSVRLVPFQLPQIGAAAKAYDGTAFELVVPMVVRGAPREMHYHLAARAIKL